MDVLVVLQRAARPAQVVTRQRLDKHDPDRLVVQHVDLGQGRHVREAIVRLLSPPLRRVGLERADELHVVGAADGLHLAPRMVVSDADQCRPQLAALVRHTAALHR